MGPGFFFSEQRLLGSSGKVKESFYHVHINGLMYIVLLSFSGHQDVSKSFTPETDSCIGERINNTSPYGDFSLIVSVVGSLWLY